MELEYKGRVCFKFRTALEIFFVIFFVFFCNEDLFASVESNLLENILEPFFKEECCKGKDRIDSIQSSVLSFSPAPGRISSQYGMRVHPILKYLKFHNGIDIANLDSTSIYASQSGVVKFAGAKGGYGMCIVIDHGFGWETTYAHLKKIFVEEGDYVGAGVVIARMGDSGFTTGTHLHFELSYFEIPLDPLPYVAGLI